MIKISPKKLLVTGGIAGALSLAGVGIASAAIPDGSGVVHACYKTSIPAHGTPLSVIDTGAGGTCPTGYTNLNLNQAGPQGPAGATGATGAAGPSTGGSSGLDLTYVTVTAPLYAWATATCPDSHPYLFGGGGYAADGTALPGYPGGAGSPATPGSESGDQSWTVPDPSGAPSGAATAYAICGK